MKDNIVVITGAGSGIGRALAIEYGKLGARLALNDFNKEGLDETEKILKDQGVKSIFSSVFDVSEKEEMQAFARQVKESWGNAHTVINNAGLAGDDLPGYLIPEESFRRNMDVNFFGVLNGCQAFLPQLVEENRGALVNVSSVFGLIGAVNNADYSASKFAVRGYTEVLGAEFTASPISIHCVHPGGIDTKIADHVNTKEFKTKHLKTPPKKMAQAIIRGINKGQSKIVYGHHSGRVKVLSWLFPQNWVNKLIWYEGKSILDISKYRTFIPGVK